MSDLLPPHPWYALHVRSRHEKSVSAQLQAKQFDVFLPLYPARHRWADRWKMLSLPLFPGYVFCRFDASAQSGVLATSGVIDVVRVGAQAAPVETSEIEAIHRVVNSPVLTEPYPTLVTGERVMLTRGPLSGLTGILVGIRNGLRLVISVELLRRSVLVEIERDWVVPSERARPAYNPGMLRQESAFLPY
ncbi:MAG TPA: UpxY family transcription antiterminator [Terriglobales bacterium]|nr:UpxY family transcription antiterminator [Terriglobales bacterium]